MSAPIAANVIGPHISFPFQGIIPNPPTAYPEGLLSMGRYLGMVEYQFTSAQLLALPGTKVQLVASPPVPPHGFGSAFALVPEAWFVQFKPKTTAYTLGNADNKFQVQYTGQATGLLQAAAAGLVDQAAGTVVRTAALAAGNLAQAVVAGLGLEMSLVGTTPALTLGDGSVIIFMHYSIVDLQ